MTDNAKLAANKFKDLAVLAAEKVLNSDKVNSKTLDGWLGKARITK